jgi:hypothetical protein
MAYVSCKYASPPLIPGDPQMVVCIDENGIEWWLTEDSQGSDWLNFKEAGGTVEGSEPDV